LVPGIDHKRLTYMHNGRPFLSDEASSKLRMPTDDRWSSDE
jgi:hypothetical protein